MGYRDCCQEKLAFVFYLSGPIYILRMAKIKNSMRNVWNVRYANLSDQNVKITFRKAWASMVHSNVISKTEYPQKMKYLDLFAFQEKKIKFF